MGSMVPGTLLKAELDNFIFDAKPCRAGGFLISVCFLQVLSFGRHFLLENALFMLSPRNSTYFFDSNVDFR